MFAVSFYLQTLRQPRCDLLAKLGVEMAYVDTEQRAAAEVQRICRSSRMLGLDIETAPLPKFLPIAWPIAVTKDGRRSKLQATGDTLPALDPFRAEIRLLQVAAEIDCRMVVFVIDLRHVPLRSPALTPLWRWKMIGHNLSFDAKMLAANGVQIADENLVDTILMAGLVLRGVEDARREGSRRPSLAVAVKEALGIDLPKTSQLSPWWRDHLTQEQIAYAALDAVFALKLAAALTPRVMKLSNGPDGKTLQSRLCEAVGPVARMELAGVTVDREALAKQANAWDEELTTLKGRSPRSELPIPRARAKWRRGSAASWDGSTQLIQRTSRQTGRAPPTVAYRRRRNICDGSLTRCRPPSCWCGSRTWSNSARILETNCSTG